jgi:hypothetical protein
MRGAIIRYGLILGLVATVIAWHLYWRHRAGMKVDWVNLCFYGFWGCISLVNLVGDAMLGQATFRVLVNAERLAWSTHPWLRQQTLPMTDIREFAIEPKPKGYALIVHPKQQKGKRARWYQLRRRGGNDLQPTVLLTHTDPIFAYRAAHALNALLATADDLSATPFLPPPPSPDPPS